MPPAKKYTTAGAFRRALDERLKTTSKKDQTDLNRLRRQVSFDRLLARLFRDAAPPWFLKGGYALELRYKAARSTVDIDLTVQSVAVSPVRTRTRSFGRCCKTRQTFPLAIGSSLRSERLLWI